MHENIVTERAHGCAVVPAADSAGARVRVHQAAIAMQLRRAGARVCERAGGRTRGCAGAGAPDQATQHVDYHSAFTGERAWVCSCWRLFTNAGAQAQVHQLEH